MTSYPPLEFTCADGPLEGRSYKFLALPPGQRPTTGGQYPDIPLLIEKGMTIARTDIISGQRVKSGGKYLLSFNAELRTYTATHQPSPLDVWPNIMAATAEESTPSETPTITNPEKLRGKK